MKSLARVIAATALFTLPFIAFSSQSHSNNTPGVSVEKLLQTQQSWDGSPYQAYPQGQPELTVLKITIAPNSSLAWHQHPIPNAAYVLQGELTVEKQSSHQTRIVKAGEVLPEMVDSGHRGFTGAQGATLIVFYAGKQGTPLSVPVK